MSVALGKPLNPIVGEGSSQYYLSTSRHSTSRRHGAVSCKDATPWGVRLWLMLEQATLPRNKLHGVNPPRQEWKIQKTILEVGHAFRLPIGEKNVSEISAID